MKEGKGTLDSIEGTRQAENNRKVER